MSKLKKYDEYIQEQDQHRIESEKDTVIQNQIDDLNSNDEDGSTDISSVDLSASQIDSLRNANVHENVINEGNVKNIMFKIQEVLEKLVNDADMDYKKFTHGNMENRPYDEYVQEIFSIITEPIGESLTEQEDIPQVILDQEEARRFKETKDTLDGKSKEVYDTTSDVEKNLEKESTDELKQQDQEEQGESTVEIDDFVIEEDVDFVIDPTAPEFKLMKECLGEDVNYTQLRNHLKETFPGWENHTGEILDIWGLIK